MMDRKIAKEDCAMKISADLAGTPLTPYGTRIHWRDTTNYAAAVLDDNPVYFDDTRSEGIIAHPCFPFSVTWPVLSRLGSLSRRIPLRQKS